LSDLQAFLGGLPAQVRSWILEQRKLHLPAARRLTQAESSSLSSYFEASTLSLALIAVVSHLENPPFRDEALALLAQNGMELDFDLSDMAGITLVDCILVRQDARQPGLLFHEMVHVAQYQALGVERFSELYVAGLARAGFVYERNPFEEIAYDLEARFLSGRSFRVPDALADWMRANHFH
jgi:hypothetical protein